MRQGNWLEGDHFGCPALGFEDISHAADNAHLHLVDQAVEGEAGAAQDEAHTFGFQGAQRSEDGRAGHGQAHALGVEADGGGQEVVLVEQVKIGGDELMLQLQVGLPHTVAGDQDDGVGIGDGCHRTSLWWTDRSGLRLGQFKLGGGEQSVQLAFLGWV